MLLRRFVVGRRHISAIKLENLVDQFESFLHALLSVSLFAGVRPQPSLLVVDGLGRERADVWVVTFKVLQLNAFLKVVNSVSPNPNLDVLFGVVRGESAKALGCKGLLVDWKEATALSKNALGRFFPARDPGVGGNVKLGRFALESLMLGLINLLWHRHGYNICRRTKSLRWFVLHFHSNNK